MEYMKKVELSDAYICKSETGKIIIAIGLGYLVAKGKVLLSFNCAPISLEDEDAKDFGIEINNLPGFNATDFEKWLDKISLS